MLGEVLTALITGAAAIVAVVLTNVASNRAVARKVEKLEKHDRENYLNILKLITVNPDLPIEERLIAGKQYLDAGGNGAVKEYYERLKEEHTK